MRNNNKARGRNVITARRASIPYTKEQLKGMFWRCDKNGDGRLSRQELEDAFSYLGAYIPGWRAKRALRYADDNGDGFLADKEIDELVKYAAQFGYTLS